MTNVARLTLCGGVGTVTGANFLLEIENKKILKQDSCCKKTQCRYSIKK